MTATKEIYRVNLFPSPFFFHCQKSGELTTWTLERKLKSLLW